jgi:hypothetical protein
MVLGLNPCKGEELFSSPKCPDWLWGSPVFLSHGYWLSVSGLKRPVLGVDHSALFSTEIKNDRNYTSTPHIRLYDLVKQSHYRPGRDLRVPGVWGSQIWRQSARKGGNVVSPTYQPSLCRRKYSWYSPPFDPSATVRPKVLCQWKIPVTPSRIDPAYFWLVAQCLKRLRLREHLRCGQGQFYLYLYLCYCYKTLELKYYTRNDTLHGGLLQLAET